MTLTDTPIYDLPPSPTATELIATLREYGVTEQMITPDMRQTIEEIADDLSHGDSHPIVPESVTGRRRAAA